jgi:hypothetical protein
MEKNSWPDRVRNEEELELRNREISESIKHTFYSVYEFFTCKDNLTMMFCKMIVNCAL